MPSLVYNVAAYVPFTKILSASANQDKTDIQNRFNWSGGTDATTGLDDTNIQSNTVASGGLTRSSKLKVGTANFIVINDGTGLMSQEAQLALSRGGLGVDFNALTKNINDVITWNGTQFVSSVTPVSPQLRVYSFFNFA